MDVVSRLAAANQQHLYAPVQPKQDDESPQAETGADSYSPNEPAEDPTAGMHTASRAKAHASPGAHTSPAADHGPGAAGVDSANPTIGTAEAPPELEAGPLESPQFLGTEAEYFKEARGMIEHAKPGDMLCLQMYEFENAETNGDEAAAKNAPGYADQQALLPALEEAAKRGVKLNIILDASKNPKTHYLANAPVSDELKKAAGSTGNVTLDYYPPDAVNIDHAKELIHLTPDGNGRYQVREALTGGSNWGNHTAANDDGGAAFYGWDAVGAAKIFFHDQAFCRGDRSSPPDIEQEPGSPVQWRVNSPIADGGGSEGIGEAKFGLVRNHEEIYADDFVLNKKDFVDEIAAKGEKAHVRVDASEARMNRAAVQEIRAHGGEATWANSEIDPEHMPKMKNHEKLNLGVDGGVANELIMGSANDSAQGMQKEYEVVSADGQRTRRKINHEIGVIVNRISTDEPTSHGTYSTEGFLDAAFAKVKGDFSAEKSLDNPPAHTGSAAQF